MSLSNEEGGKINAILIFEVLGRPPEKLTETLNEIINQIDKERGISVKEKDIKEPVEMKEEKGFYSSFAEVEIKAEEISNIGMIVFKYMPSHIEIISPESITLTNNECNNIFNEITRRLHGYDEVARVVQFEKAVLEKKLRSLLEKTE